MREQSWRAFQRPVKTWNWASYNLCIHPFMPDQRLMRPVFDDMSVIHDNDAIDAMDGGKAMRNDDRRSPFGEIVQRLTNLDFGLGIDIGGRLIEDDDRRVLQNTRAIETRCRCLTERLTPRSPIQVSYPSGRAMMKSCARATFAAASTSS